MTLADMRSVTADLIDPTDLSLSLPDMDSPRHPSPGVGAIGEPSPSLFSFSQSTHYPVSYHTNRTTKPPTPHTDQAADVDLAALIAQAHRQHEADKSRVTHNGGQPLGHGHGVIGEGLAHNGHGMTRSGLGGYNGNGTGSEERRWGLEEWERERLALSSSSPYAAPRSATIPTPSLGAGVLRAAPPSYPIASPRTAVAIPHSPVSARTVPAAPNSASAGYPVAGPTADPAGQVAHHLSAIQGLLGPMMSGVEDMERLKKEVEMWKGEWGRVEREKKRLEGVVQGMEDRQAGKVGQGFTAVLIDGDGLIFQDHLLQQGFQGGQLAARTLLSSLPSLASHAEISPTSATHGGEIIVDTTGAVISDGAMRFEGEIRELGSVVVMVFLNKSGLGSTLVKAGAVPTWSVYDQFWQGFSAAHELFTVIDVGQGKEATDAKIREFLRLFVKNVQCEMIVLGASHDNGYANILSSLQTESRLSKLLLLKGYTDLAYQLKQYSGRVVSVPDLFRTTKLPNANANANANAPAGVSFSSIVQSHSHSHSQSNRDSAAPVPDERTKPQMKNLRKVEEAKAAAAAVAAGIADENSTYTETSTSSPSLGVDSDVEIFEWNPNPNPNPNPSVEVKRHAPGVGLTGTIKKKGSIGAGIGTGAASVASAAKNDEWHEAGKKGKKFKGKETVRDLKPRPCHTFYLSPWGCKAGDDCGYAHHYNLNDNQLAELRKLAKEIICPYARNNKCHFSEEECVYGHRCPRMDKCTFGDTCRFKVLPNGHGEVDGATEGVKRILIL